MSFIRPILTNAPGHTATLPPASHHPHDAIRASSRQAYTPADARQDVVSGMFPSESVLVKDRTDCQKECVIIMDTVFYVAQVIK